MRGLRLDGFTIQGDELLAYTKIIIFYKELGKLFVDVIQLVLLIESISGL